MKMQPVQIPKRRIIARLQRPKSQLKAASDTTTITTSGLTCQSA